MTGSFLFSFIVFLLLRGLEEVGVAEPIPTTAKQFLVFINFFGGTELNVSRYLLFQRNSFFYLIAFLCEDHGLVNYKDTNVVI